MDELWMRSVATVYEGKIEDFKRLAEEMLSTIRDKDCEFTQVEVYGDPTPQACVTLAEAGPAMSYYPALAAFSAVSGEPAASAQMSPEEVVRKFFDCYTNGRPEDFYETVAPDYVDCGQTPPGRGPSGARDNYEDAVKQAGAVIRYTIDALVADGDVVAATWTGTLPSGGEAKGLSLYRTSGGLLRSTRQALIGTTPS